MVNKPKEKMFVIKKYVMAISAAEAIRKEKKIAPLDCWVDDEWRKNEKDALAVAIGYTYEKR